MIDSAFMPLNAAEKILLARNSLLEVHEGSSTSTSTSTKYLKTGRAYRYIDAVRTAYTSVNNQYSALRCLVQLRKNILNLYPELM